MLWILGLIGSYVLAIGSITWKSGYWWSSVYWEVLAGFGLTWIFLAVLAWKNRHDSSWTLLILIPSCVANFWWLLKGVAVLGLWTLGGFAP
ncbi:MAG: hypothetical protein CAPSK01_001518 [Candidatus Accumulibacter vicinus]|uniref:Uncharacterized protein n=1 Tax=Candidatus Accumulibacter vicinus TaxID=2954382 RepID=A0A084Y1S1_9PROT|nr:MAG: hypothetical protein CAPSK01_001518 [Candidatus Accumulibacter vicinus]